MGIDSIAVGDRDGNKNLKWKVSKMWIKVWKMNLLGKVDFATVTVDFSLSNQAWILVKLSLEISEIM
jgi:hypothetical protein